MTEPLLTDTEMALRYGKSRGWVQDRCRKGWPHLRAGKSSRFTPEHVAAIDALLEVGKPAPVVATAAEKFGRRGRSA